MEVHGKYLGDKGLCDLRPSHTVLIFVGEVYMVVFAVIRFADEFLRGDKIRGIYGGVSTAQWISLIILFVYGLEYIKGRYSKKVNSSF